MKVCRICTAVLGDEEFCPICGAPSKAPERTPNPAVAPARSLPSLHDCEGSCVVCGIPMHGEICEMCGSPRITVRDKEIEFRCPFCEKSVDPNATRCPHCGIDYVSRDKDRDMEYRCPVCSEEASLLEDTCSACGAKIWLDFESERSSVSRFLCPMCGEEVQADSRDCPKCGAGIWVGEEGAKESAEVAIGSASSEIAEEMAKAPADLGRAEVVLVSAKEAFERGDYMAANRAANLSAEIAKATVLQTKIFQDAVRRAQSTISSLEEKGGDSSDAVELLRRAVRVKQTGNIRGAVRLAIKSRIKAEESVPGPRLSDIDLK